MKTLEVHFGGSKTTIFVDKILYIKKANSSETNIFFTDNMKLTIKIEYDDLINRIKKL